MRAMVLRRFGGPDVLSCEEVARPEAGPDQVLIRVACCGVCGHDLLNRDGAFPGTRLPCIMGHEISGTVEEAGPLVRGIRPGDRVALNQRLSCGTCEPCRAGRDNLCRSGPGFYGEELSGGYGDFVVASARNAVSLPDEIPSDVGAILSCAIGTGYHALRRARLRLGDTVVITAASGGVGIHAVKLARLMGLRTIAITSSAAKRDRLLSAGADEAIVAPAFSFHGDVKALTRGAGADAVIEIAGASTFVSGMRSLKAGGRLVVVGNLDPGNVPLNPAVSILKEIEIVGSAHATAGDLQAVVELVRLGRITAEIGHVLPVVQAAQAHRLMSDRATVGRVVLSHS